MLKTCCSNLLRKRLQGNPLLINFAYEQWTIVLFLYLSKVNYVIEKIMHFFFIYYQIFFFLRFTLGGV